ncbi:MAG: hypothetical protein K8R48_07250 [Alphaproteobacteria bacterium]|nr:hypothetical protein [Alphaproteobacteria bacterium]
MAIQKKVVVQTALDCFPLRLRLAVAMTEKRVMQEAQYDGMTAFCTPQPIPAKGGVAVYSYFFYLFSMRYDYFEVLP